MKKFTNSLKALSVLFLILSAKLSVAQCTASFIYSNNGGGAVTFSSTSITGTNTTYYWTFGNGSPTFTGTGSVGMYPSTTFTANGSYTVNLFIMSVAPSCSNGAMAVITITNAGGTACNLNANFNYSQGANGLVNFNNTSSGTASTTTYAWSFGNGNTSTSTSPSTTYTANGTYIATLTVNNNFTTSCVSTKTVAVVVNSYCTLNAAFTANIGSNGSVTFVNNTTPSAGASYTWSFGNSNTSNLTNPSTVYGANGTYTVTLQAHTNSTSCNSSTTAVINITNVASCNLNANFTASQGANGLVNFNNTSTGIVSATTYTWNFGNGTSNAASPTNVFSTNGVYTVTLSVSNNTTPSCTSTKTLNIGVNSNCNLAAGFTYSLGANGLVNFYNTTTNSSSLIPTMYSWNFGSAPSSTVANPSHTYLNGTYTVVLTATSFSPNCTNTVSQVIAVTSSTCVANANFTLVPTSTPQYWNAIPSNVSNVTSAQWSWGDGSVSNSLYTSHLYSVSATYTICLSTTVNCGATSVFCSSYFVYKSAEQSSGMIQVDILDPSTVGLKNVNLDKANYMVYPNPNAGSFSIQMNGLKEGVVKVEVYNLVGEKVSESISNTTSESFVKEINAKDLSNGVYLLKISNNSNTVIKKVSIQK